MWFNKFRPWVGMCGVCAVYAGVYGCGQVWEGVSGCALQAVYSIDGKSTSISKTVLIEKFLVVEYLFLNGSVVKALDS